MDADRIFYSMSGKTPVMHIEGSLTVDTESSFMAVYEKIIREHSPLLLILNFEKVRYINSTGIALLISLIHDMNAKQGRLSFVGLSEHFRRVMEIVNISDLVDIHPTAADALK